jgi:hypothetical protein
MRRLFDVIARAYRAAVLRPVPRRYLLFHPLTEKLRDECRMAARMSELNRPPTAGRCGSDHAPRYVRGAVSPIQPNPRRASSTSSELATEVTFGFCRTCVVAGCVATLLAASGTTVHGQPRHVAHARAAGPAQLPPSLTVSTRDPAFNRIASGPSDVLWQIDFELGVVHAIRLRGDGRRVGPAWASQPADVPRILPHAIASTGSPHLFVLDRHHQQLVRFDGAAAPLAYHGRVRLPVPSRDVCAIGADVYVLSDAADRIDVFSENLKHQRTVRVALGESPFPTEASNMNAARLVCAPTANALVIVPVFHDEIIAISPDGQTKWRTKLPSYRTIAVRAVAPGALQIGPPPGGHHQAMAGLEAAGDALLIQLAVVGARPAVATRYTHMLALASGRILDSTDRVPAIVGSTVRTAVTIDNGKLLLNTNLLEGMR